MGSSRLENYLGRPNAVLVLTALWIFILLVIIIAYVLFLFDIENRKQRRLGVVSFISYICSLYFLLAYREAAKLWERGLYLPIRRPSMIALFLIFWAVGTLTLAVMINKMAKNDKHNK